MYYVKEMDVNSDVHSSTSRVPHELLPLRLLGAFNGSPTSSLLPNRKKKGFAQD